ncbi:hypothetical protein KIPB_011552, partial [Kipferlia bialata]
RKLASSPYVMVEHPEAIEIPSPPVCMAVDEEGGKYGFGRPLPGWSCYNLVYAPNDVEWVNDVAAHMQLDTGWTDTEVLGLADQDALDTYVEAYPGTVGWGVVFGTDEDNRDLMPDQLEVYISYNGTLIDPFNMYSFVRG